MICHGHLVHGKCDMNAYMIIHMTKPQSDIAVCASVNVGM
jgi:hypothetical protein